MKRKIYLLGLVPLLLASCKAQDVANLIPSDSNIPSDSANSKESQKKSNDDKTSVETASSTGEKKEEIVINNKDFKMLSYGGINETIYAEFLPVSKYKSYNVYYKNQQEDYKKIDKELLRLYKYNDSYKYRVDIVGLKKDVYDLSIRGVVDNNEEVLQEIKGLNVSEYDREGFSFSKDSTLKSGSGAYNDDGSLKKNAQVIYVDKTNAKTCKAIVNGKEVTGLQSILDAKQKKTSTEILDIRIIGEVKKEDLDHISSSAEGLQIKGASAYQDMGITIEGIGYDACVNGFGFLIRNAGNVEIRNLGILNFMDDGVSLDTNNSNIWIHNNDFYYGQAGGDSDQAKGDGTTDIKGNSMWITVSYNHYYDSGKSSLCGMKSESGPNYITYHHNWFDHSDSRHPRVRTMSVHVYNNYYDGNSKYGVGSTTGSSVFVEGNYFRNCKYPMMSSLQGTDAKGDGTFSGENGGVIKAYNNTIIGAKSLIYQNSSTEFGEQSLDSFDAYLASSRDEVIPDSIKAKVGGTSYDNFDTKIDLGVSNVDTPADAKNKVIEYSGRLNGGDFKFKFSDEEDSSYAINQTLKDAVTKYSNTTLLTFIGQTSQEETKPTEPDVTKPEVNPISSDVVLTFNKAGKVDSTNSFETSPTTKKVSGVAYTKDGQTYEYGLKMDSKGFIKFNVDKKVTLTIIASGKSSGATLMVGGQKLTINSTNCEELTIELEKGSYEIKKGKTESYIYMIIIK